MYSSRELFPAILVHTSLKQAEPFKTFPNIIYTGNNPYWFKLSFTENISNMCKYEQLGTNSDFSTLIVREPFPAFSYIY
jgi:hypothetical protein